MTAPDMMAVAQASRVLLQQGDAAGAESLLAPIVNDLKADPSVLHLMGQIKQAQNRLQDAERYYRAAIADALSEGIYYNDLGAVLMARQQYPEAARVFRAAGALMPESAVARVNLVRCLMAAGELKDAEREARAYVDAALGAESWTLMMHVQRAMDRYEDALVSAEQAVRYAPTQRGTRFNYAVSLDRVGRAKEALNVYSTLAREEIDTPELAVNFSRALHGEGRAEEAEAVLEAALQLWPGAQQVHITLARQRWLRGAGEESTAAIEGAVTARPNDLALRLICADLLRRGGFTDRARRYLEEGLKLAPNSAAYLTSLGIVLDETGEPEKALTLLRRALELSPEAPLAKRNLLETLLRLSRADEALAIARELRQTAPLDQHLIAFEALAMRMLGDPEYKRLYDYDALVKTYDLAAPRGYFNIDNFNASLAESLVALHRTPAHPMDLSLRGGSQTGRNLVESSDEIVRAFFTALEAPVRAYIEALDPQTEVGRRLTRAFRFSGCWSTRLQPGGHHLNHVHTAGWISSAYYVRTPGVSDDKAGWLKFGEPRLPTPNCRPEKFVQPRPGLLVLFPSYMWHGTMPAPPGGERLAAAFDVIPA